MQGWRRRDRGLRRAAGASLEGITGGRLNAASAVGAAGPPRFNLGAEPASQTVSQGESTSYTIDVASIAGFTGDAALTVAADPALDATVDVTPVVTAPGDWVLTVAHQAGADAGSLDGWRLYAIGVPN